MGSYASHPWGQSIYKINWSSSVWSIYLFSAIYLFIPQFIDTNMDLHIFISCFELQSNNTFLFCYIYCSSFRHQDLFCLALVSLWHAFYFFFLRTFLLYSTVRWPMLLLNISFSGPRINYFSNEPWSLLLENGIRNQDLGAWCARCYWGVLASHPVIWQRKKMYICVLTHVCMHIYKYFYS